MTSGHRNGRVSRALAITLAAFAANSAFALTSNIWEGVDTDDYNAASNWSEDRVPNSGDVADIYSGPVSLTTSPGTLGSLLVSKIIGPAGQFFTGGYKLTVSGAVDVDQPGQLYVQYPPTGGGISLQAGSMAVTNGGLVDMDYSNSRTNITNNLSVDATSKFETEGRLDVGGTYTNNGTLHNNDDSTITADTFTMSGTAANPATIDANGQAITINATTFNLHDFNSTIDASDYQSDLDLEGTPNLVPGNIGATVNIGDSAQLSLGVGEWLFGYYQKSGAFFVQRGSVNLNGGPTLARAAKINENGIYFTSVNVTGYGNMETGEFDGGCSINVAANSYLYVGSGINGPYFRGTPTTQEISVNGPGTVYWNGDTTIGYSSGAYTEVDVEANVNFAWAGTSGANASCDIQNGELDIYSTTIDPGAVFNAYLGQLNVEAGSKLNMAGNSWLMAGPVTMGTGAVITGQTMFMAGGGLPAGEYALTVQTSGGSPAVVSAPLDLLSGVVFFPQSVFANSLRFDGVTTYAGASVASGPYVQGTQPYGTLIQNGDATVNSNTSIFCNTLDMDGTSNTASWTINAGDTLSMQAWFLDANNSTNNPFHSTITINGGTLDMETNAGAWTLAGGAINMNLSPSNSPYITHDKLILGSGATNGTINVGGGTTAYITGPLRSAASSVSGGNLISIGVGSTLYVSSSFGSDASAVLTKTGAGTLVISGPQSHGAGAIININQGEMDLNTNAGTLASATLGVNVTGKLVAGSDQHLASVHILSGGVVSLASGANKVLRTSSFTIDGGATPAGTFDISNDGAIIDYTGSTILPTISGYVANAYDKGAWDKPGIMTSSALTKKGTAVGYADNNQFHYSTFDNQSVGLNTILIKYTWYGDLNLDGKVNSSDLALMKTGSGWSHGDLNYDGVVNADDFALFDLGSALQDGSIGANVPEPMLTAIIFLPVLFGRSRKFL